MRTYRMKQSISSVSYGFVVSSLLLGICVVGLGGCFSPDYGPVSFSCAEKGRCPSGYSCQDTSGGKVCVKDGVTLDGSVDVPGKPDLGPDGKPTGDLTPDGLRDRGPGPDAPLDLGPKPDLSRDLTPKPDQARDLLAPDTVTWPAVRLISPANKATMGLKAPAFVYELIGSGTFNCTLYLGDSLGGNMKAVAGPTPYTAGKQTDKPGALNDDTYTWQVRCAVGGSTVVSPVWQFKYGPLELTGCKTGGWAANTRYELLKTIYNINIDCFTIDKSDVVVDFGGFDLIAGSYKDIVYHRGTAEPVSVLSNKNGTVNKTPVWTSPYSSDNPGNDHTAGDFDGDLRLDLVTQAVKGTLRAFKGTATGGLSNTAFFNSAGINHTASQVLDFDQDGDADLLAATVGGKETFYQYAGGGLSFASSTQFGTNTTSLDLGNFDGDTRVDALFGNELGSDDARHVARAVPSGSTVDFVQSWSSPLTEARGKGTALIADVNGDQKWDLVLPRTYLNNSSGTTTLETATVIYHGNGLGGFTRETTLNGYLPLGAGDVTGDGNTNLVLYGTTAAGDFANITFFDRATAGSWTSMNAITITPGVKILFGLLADLDGDARPDLVLALDKSLSSLLGYRNTTTAGSLNLKPVAVMGATGSLPGKAHHIALRDMNNNGKLEIVSAHTDSGAGAKELIYLCTAGTSGNYSCQEVVSQPVGHPYGVYVLGDLDGAPIRAVTVSPAAKNVTLKNFGTVRGFAVAVDIAGDAATVDTITVDDPGFYGVRFQNVTAGSVNKLTLKNHFQGAGFAAIKSGVSGGTRVEISNSNLCPAGVAGRLAPVSSYCVGSNVRGTGNTLFVNNGCVHSSSKTCR